MCLPPTRPNEIDRNSIGWPHQDLPPNLSKVYSIFHLFRVHKLSSKNALVTKSQEFCVRLTTWLGYMPYCTADQDPTGIILFFFFFPLLTILIYFIIFLPNIHKIHLLELFNMYTVLKYFFSSCFYNLCITENRCKFH